MKTVTVTASVLNEHSKLCQTVSTQDSQNDILIIIYFARYSKSKKNKMCSAGRLA